MSYDDSWSDRPAESPRDGETPDPTGVVIDVAGSAAWKLAYALALRPPGADGEDTAATDPSTSATPSPSALQWTFPSTAEAVAVAPAAATALTQAQVNQLSAGIVQALGQIDANVVSQVFSEALPIVGSNLQAAAAGGGAPLHYAQTLGQAIQAGLATLSGSASYSAAQVESAIDTALANAGFQGNGVTLDWTDGGNLRFTFDTAKAVQSVNVAIGSDVGLPKLGLSTSGAAQAVLSHGFDFTAGLDAGGFYIATSPGTSVFTLTEATTTSGFNGSVSLGSIPYSAVNSAATPTGFTGTFTLQLKDPGGDGKLRGGELGGDLIDATLSGSGGLRWDLASSLPAGTSFPSFGTQLRIVWSYADATVDPTDDNAGFGGVPEVRFDNSWMELGSFLNGLVGPALDLVNDVTAPMQPVIDILTTPLPLLADLGSKKQTLLDFAGSAPEDAAAIKGLADIVKLAAAVRAYNAAGEIVDLGSSIVVGDLRQALAADLAVQVTRDRGGLGATATDFLDRVGKVGGGGLAFPILSDQLTVGRLNIGQDVDLYTYKATTSFELPKYEAYFPTFGWAGIKLGGQFSMDGRFDFGYDSAGLRAYVQGGSVDGGLLYDGYYVRGEDASGQAGTGFQIKATVTAGVEAKLGLVTPGVDGDLTATIDFALASALNPDEFGRIRGLTLASTPATDWFRPSGQITTGLHAYVEVGIDPFSKKFEWDSPRVILLNFDGDANNKPVAYGLVAGGDLALNVGPRSNLRLVGNTNDIAEKVLIDNGPLGLVLSGFGFVYLPPTPSHFVAEGGERSDELLVGATVAVPVHFSGGLSRDILTGGAAADWLSGDEGADVLDGNGGSDTLLGGAGPDRLIGGAGADSIDGGDGADTLSFITAGAGMVIDLRTDTFSGDGAGDTRVSIERYEGTNFADTIDGGEGFDALLAGAGGNDTIAGHGGDDLIDGGDGADSLLGGAGNDFMLGGAGADTIAGGTGVNTLSYDSAKVPVAINLATGLGSAGDALGDVVSGFTVLIGAPVPYGDLAPFYDSGGRPQPNGTGDTLVGSDAAETISGLGGGDSIDGGGGDDRLWGDWSGITGPILGEVGLDADTLRGGAGNDSLEGQGDDDDLDGGTGQDTLEGGAGNDHLRTFDLGDVDTLDGGAGTNRLSADYSDKEIPIVWIDGQTNDYSFADGDLAVNFQRLGEFHSAELPDQILLDGPADENYSHKIFTNGGNDLVRAGAGFDSVSGGDGNDTIWAGANADFVDAGDGDDFVDSGDDDAELVFEPSFGGIVDTKGPRDALHGGAGVDTLSFANLNRSVIYIGIGADNGKTFPLGVYVNLATNQTGYAALNTTISGFENVIGTKGGDWLIGNDADNVFQPLRGGGLSSGSTGGPDRIDGAGGTDTLVIDFSAADIADAKGVTTNGTTITRANLAGTAAADAYIYSGIEQLRLTGASKGDQLYAWTAGANADWLSGLGGNDTLGGKGGSDTLLGGDGDDVLTAQGTFAPAYDGATDGTDLLDGGAGNDLVEDIAIAFGGPTATAGAKLQLDGGSGNDTLSADFSNQTQAIVWNSAAPTDVDFANGAYFHGFEQLALFASGSGNDDIRQAGRVNNTFWLGAGDDTVRPGLGNDSVYGGDGVDTVVLDFSVGDSAALAPVRGGGDSYYWYRPTLADPFNRPDGVYVNGVERMQVTGTAKNDSISGLYGDDTLVGGDGDDVLDGWWGGNNRIDGGAGNDSLRGSMGWAGSGSADTLLGGAGNDTLRPLTGNDSVVGGDGNDDIAGEFFGATGAFGDDVFSGGAGDDVISDVVVNSGYPYAAAGDRLMLDGGTGNDTVSADVSNQTQGFVFVGGTTNSIDFADGSYLRNFEALGSFIGSGGADRLVQPGRVNNYIVGAGGNDTIEPGLGIDTVYGGNNSFFDPGNDLLVLDYSADDGAGLGGVTGTNGSWQRSDLATGAVVDSVFAGAFERVRITGASKADSIPGSWGDDTLVGNAGNDTLFGDYGADSLVGGLGNDWLDGGVHADTMEGGAGNDTYVVEAGDTIIEAAGGGFDTMRSETSATLVANVEAIVLTGSQAVNATGNAAANALTGNAAGNVLTGGAGDDTLTGLGGNDTLIGGDGKDTYLIDDLADQIVEADTPGSGIDTVSSTVSATLGANLERLVLGGTAAIDGTGNVLANTLVGNAAANRLSGGEGNDTLAGNGGDDSLVGGGGDDSLLGGSGADTLAGGDGNDIYVVGANDTISESGTVSSTRDLVKSGVSWTLGANVERLTLTGAAAISGTGNTLANVITGNTAGNVLRGNVGDDTLSGGAGNDTLIGGSGGDSMIGGTGNDIYYVGSKTDTVVETSTVATEIDTVRSTASTVTLVANVENLLLQGSGSISGTGNGLANTIVGNTGANTLLGLAGKDTISGGDGADTLDGGAGNDSLIGGAGADVFAFTSALNATSNVDRVSDFVAADDAFRLDDAVFAGIGPVGALAAGAFRLGAAAGDANDRVIYNSATGQLFFDADGTGATAQILFAIVAPGTAITAADFFIT